MAKAYKLNMKEYAKGNMTGTPYTPGSKSKGRSWDKNKSDDQLKFKGTSKHTALLSRIKGVKGYGQ